MLTEVDPLHTVIDIVSPLAIVAAAWIGLSIKSAVLKASLDHQAAAAEVKDELIERATKVENAVAVHIADDKGEFREIRASLDRIENRGRQRRATDPPLS